MLALDVKDKKRQRALLLYYAGQDVHSLYQTLQPEPSPDEEFAAAKEKLTAYFEPKMNITYEVYNFRRMKQGESDEGDVSMAESIDSFVTRLRKKAKRCQLANEDTEVRYQVIFGCRSAKLRREGLKKDTLTLNELVDLGRMHEMVMKQANDMEKTPGKEHVNMVKPGRYSRRHVQKAEKMGTPADKTNAVERKCFFCGGTYPHQGGRKGCPAWGRTVISVVYLTIFRQSARKRL